MTTEPIGTTIEPIGNHVRRGFLWALAITIALAVAATLGLLWMARVQDEVVDRGLRLVVLVRELENTVDQRALHLRGLLLTDREEQLTAMRAGEERTTELVTDIADVAREDRALALLRQIEGYEAEYRVALEGALAIREDRSATGELTAYLDEEVFPARQRLADTVHDLALFEEQVVDDGVADAKRARTLLLVLFTALAAGAAVLNILTANRINRRVTGALAEVSQAIVGATSETLTANTQQVSGAAEQAAAIQQTVTTVDELSQSADETMRRARAVVAKTEESVRTAEHGSTAVEEATEGMADIRDQVNAIAETILDLARRAQAISGIVDTVDDIAEQTNLLALNAAIEAARAGEQGRGFSVVAAEVRELADQSKRATGEIAGILGEIQDATNKAVMATEEGTQGATSGMTLISQAGATISDLAQAVEEATVAAEQIAAAAEQQAGAAGQISTAMGNVSDVMEQNLAAARQSEQTARDLNDVAERLRALVGAG